MAETATVTAKQIMQMLERQQFRCAISGRSLTPETVSLDHIVPVSRGGMHAPSNVWAVDHQVNAAKGSLTLDEFVGLCREVADHRRESFGRDSAASFAAAAPPVAAMNAM